MKLHKEQQQQQHQDLFCKNNTKTRCFVTKTEIKTTKKWFRGISRPRSRPSDNNSGPY